MQIEYLTLGVYFLVLLALGKVFSRFNRSLSDFARGGGRFTWWMAGSSMLMAGISAFTFTGNASAAFEAGPSMLIIYVANVLGFLFGAVWLGPWFRQTRAYTAADVVRGRFGRAAEQFSAYAGLLLNPFAAAVQLWALALFVSATFGFPLTATIVTVGTITVLYSAGGGAWAVAATDFVQAVVLVSVTLLVGALAWTAVGGASGLVAGISRPEFAGVFSMFKPAGAFPADRYTWSWALAVFLMQMVGQLNLATSVRYLGVKDGREASRAAWLAGGLMAVGSFVWFLPPMVARLLYADVVLAMPVKDPATTAYAVVAMKLLPAGLLGVLIAAMFAATMSSMDSGLNSQTSIIVRNILPRLRECWGGREPGETTQLRLCRSITLLLGGGIIVGSVILSQQDRFVLFEAFLTLSSLVGVPLTLPLMAGLLLRRLPVWAYFFIFGCSVLPSLVSVVDERLTGNAWSVQERAYAVLGCGFASIAICGYRGRFNAAAQRAREDDFFATMRRPVDFSREIGSDRDGEQAVLLGRAVTTMGAMMLAFLLVPNAWSGRALILVLVAGVLTVGGGLWAYGARRLALDARERAMAPEAAGALPAAAGGAPRH